MCSTAGFHPSGEAKPGTMRIITRSGKVVRQDGSEGKVVKMKVPAVITDKNGDKYILSRTAFIPRNEKTKDGDPVAYFTFWKEGEGNGGSIDGDVKMEI